MRHLSSDIGRSVSNIHNYLAPKYVWSRYSRSGKRHASNKISYSTLKIGRTIIG